MEDRLLLEYLEGFISAQRKERFARILEERTKFITVAIEDVFQVHNSSAVIRSCDIFGIQEAHIIEDRFGKRLDKNIAMGAQQWVDVHRYDTTQSCVDKLRERGYKIIATTPDNRAVSLEDFKIDQKIALFLGTEKEGLSSTVIDGADAHLRIPMFGFTESLNISVSAAIILYNLTSKLKSETIFWHLTEQEKFEKRLDWTKKSIKSIDQVLIRYYQEH